jgi:hypothetical protein
LLPAQARQVPFSQKGVPPEQLALEVHDWQRLVVVLQRGLPPVQWLSMLHWTQRPPAQAGVEALFAWQAAFPPHGVQAPSALQIGRAGSWLQWALMVHSTQAPARAPVFAHWVLEPQSPSWQARQRPAATSQIGVVPAQ